MSTGREDKQDKAAAFDEHYRGNGCSSERECGQVSSRWRRGLVTWVTLTPDGAAIVRVVGANTNSAIACWGDTADNV